MILLIECIIFCILFTLIILPAQYKDPLNMIMSYPPKIIKRAEELLEYKEVIGKKEKAHIGKKIFGLIFFVIVLSGIAYLSGCRNFGETFIHVFTIFFAVNIFDLIVLDWGIFCHSKKLRIAGTEYMEKEYKDYLFHVKGACIGIVLGFVVALISGCIIGFTCPTFTPEIKESNGISELRKVNINDDKLEIMIRGIDKDNPVIIFVHGGPCCSEIPYVRKYQDDLEKDFTIVHYDQRGSGKSYVFGKDYSKVTTQTHVSDLLELTRYIESYLEKEKVILIGHSFGTYISTIAAAQNPELYQAYIGIGQMSNPIEGELNNLSKCIEAAKEAGNEKDVNYLKNLEQSILEGNIIAPRDYVRKYEFAAIKINEDKDYLLGFLFGKEYNLIDAIRFYTASIKYQDKLIKEAFDFPITQIVTKIDIPVYFAMGKYDGMTSPEAAKKYLDNITGTGKKEFVLFEESAHYPQFEEEQKFCEWMINTFK